MARGAALKKPTGTGERGLSSYSAITSRQRKKEIAKERPVRWVKSVISGNGGNL